MDGLVGQPDVCLMCLLLSSCCMTHRNSKEKPWTSKQRAFLAFMGIVIMGLGGGTLLSGKLEYRNYWNGPVFAPFALMIGAFAVFVAIKARRY